MHVLKKILKSVIFLMLAVISFVIIYLAVERILSRNVIDDQFPQEKKHIVIYLKSNGVHTDIVMPVKDENMDWSRYFPYENTISQDSTYQFIAVGWGDKGFYLNTPEWKDLTIKTAWVAMTGIGQTALHVTYYHDISEDDQTKKLTISQTQYKLLQEYIISQIELDDMQRSQSIRTDAQYGDSDSFYEAHGSYSMFFTCNTWTNVALKYSGIKCSRWAAFESGILAIH